jgi:hypothetical protein
MCFFYSYFSEDELKNNILDSEFKYSYKEVIQLLIVVINFHTDKINGEKYLKKFEEISKKLDYPLFTKDYLINYFI